ncbi:hypothetical protein [Corallococcus sp. AB038B]|uniref:hypothetical protein n=1 Tax=Corallococcus sp. AB038B TaxID=2316718 RepID=UPI001315451D|nr:hypothetical protein [Corallococcus sp. AB038B]
MHLSGLFHANTTPVYGRAFGDLADVLAYVSSMGAKAIELMDREVATRPDFVRWLDP